VRFTVIAEWVWRGGALPAGTAESTETSESLFPFTLCIPWIMPSWTDPAENRAKSGVFSGNTGNLPRLRMFLEDMLFVGLRFCGNEAILGGL